MDYNYNKIYQNKKKEFIDRRKSKSFFYQHVSITCLSICITFLFALVATLARPLDPIKRAIKEFSFTDIYYEILKDGTTPDTCRFITIVDMTQLYDRSDIAHLLYNIGKYQPKVIGLDVCFDDEGENIIGNDSLIHVIEKFNNIVFSSKMFDWKDDSIGWTKEVHSFFYDATDIKEGTVNMPRTLYDNIKRRVPLYELFNGEYKPSIVTQLANNYAGSNIIKNRKEDVNINFSPTIFRILQYDEVEEHPELIRGQVVLVGGVYDDTDVHWTPIGKMSGVELIAYGLQSVMYNNEPKYLPMPMLAIVSLLIILIIEVLQHIYLEHMSKSRNIFVRYIIGSTYVLNIFTFFSTSILLAISFFIFVKYNLSINLAWSLSVIAFLGTSRNMHKALRDYFDAWNKKEK